MRSLLSLSLLLLLSTSLFSFQSDIYSFDWKHYENQYLIRNFTTEDGLPVNSINRIISHKNGYLYITSFDGLIRFDGHTFVNFNTANTPGFKSNRLGFIMLDGDENLWIVDVARNLYLFRDGRAESLQDYLDQPNIVVYQIVKDGNGDVWASTDVGVYRQQKGMDFKLVEGTDQLGRILGLDFKQTAGITFLSEDGLYSVSNSKIQQLLSASQLPISPTEIFRIESSSDGSIWLLGKSENTFIISTDNFGSKITVPKTPGFTINDIIEETDQALLVKTNHGYYLVDKQTLEIHPSKLPQIPMIFQSFTSQRTKDGQLIQAIGNTLYLDGKPAITIDQPITEVSVDFEGSIWLGTNSRGLFQATPRKVFTLDSDLHPSINNIYSIVEDSLSNIWVSGLYNSKGISEITDSEIRQKENPAEKGALFNVLTTPPGKIFGAFPQGLYHYSDDTWEKTDFSIPNILSLHKVNDDTYWFGNTDDAYLFKHGTTTSISQLYGNKLGRVYKILSIADSTIIFLTSSKGIVLLDPEKSLQFINTDTGLSSNQVRDVYVATKDTLWAVTEDFGLTRIILNSQHKVIKSNIITTNDGLLDNSLHRMIRDSFGFVWINSNKGIMRINERDLNLYADGKITVLNVQSFTREDGLQNPEGNGGVQSTGLLTHDGKILFPNQAGVVYTRPEWHISNSKFPLSAPRVEYLNYSDSTVYLTGKNNVKLPKSVRNFQIHFTLPTFTSPDKLILEYKLAELNSDWQRVGEERLASFTSLSGGTKTFKMRGRLIGEPDYVESSFNIFIPLKFYETFWFKLFTFLGFLGAFVLTFRIAIHRARNREHKLEIMVQKRTVELEESRQKVQASLKKIQELDELKSEFFTNFTHELRTPLSLILAPLEDMLETDQQPKDKNLSLMKRNAERLKELVNQLLDVSKLNSGELTLTLQPIAIPAFTRQITSQFEHTLSKKDITFSLDFSESMQPVYVDARAWEHIIINLMSNAVKFTPEHGEVSITFQEHSDHVTISLKDSGTGIPPDDLPHIFEAYYQGKNSQAKAEGTGIGLSLVHGLITRMKGEITARSKPNNGTEFILKLRKGFAHFEQQDIISHSVMELPPTSELILPTKESEPQEITESPSKPSILLVEDNDDFREYISSVIQENYNVKTAKNGKEGLKMLESIQPDIILSDIMMPEMDGIEMMQEIRSRQEFTHLPFIFLSAKDTDQDIELGLNNGADIYLTKPIQKRLLLTQIKALLRREERLMKATDRRSTLSPFHKEILEILERHLGNPDLNIDLIAQSVSMSRATLYRKWKKESDLTLNQLITQLRMEEAIRLINEENLNFSEASFVVGYTTLSYFSQAFKKEYGVSPQEYFANHT